MKNISHEDTQDHSHDHHPRRGVYIALAVIGVIAIFFLAFQLAESTKQYSHVAVAVLLTWLSVVVAYYAWAVYYYNINLGYTASEWREMRGEVRRAKARKESGEEVPESEMQLPDRNPYEGETFGLPNGTVRGTLALTVLVGACAILIVAMGDTTPRAKEYEYFVLAFQMMIAFYFGSRAVDAFKARQDAKSGASKATGAKPQAETRAQSSTAAAERAAPAKELESAGTSREAATDALPEESADNESFAKPLAGAATFGSFFHPPTTTAQPVSLRNSVGADFPHLTSRESAQRLTKEDVAAVAEQVGLEAAVMKAVIEVESSGKGFLPSGRPKILFEGHIFWRELQNRGIDPRQHLDRNADILYARWTRQFYKGGEAEYERLERARRIHEEAADSSASWGLFQIMGNNFKAAGFPTVDAFVDAQHESEKRQLEAFCVFITHEKLLASLKSKEWAAFAKRYNGPGYQTNKYDVKLKQAYERHAGLERV